jgi:hypothetical protein
MFYEIDRSTHLRNLEQLESADKPGTNAENGEQPAVRAIS